MDKAVERGAMAVSVLQWNVWHEESLWGIGQYLRSIAADIICLQEVSIARPDQEFLHGPSYLAGVLGYHCAFTELRNTRADGSMSAMANAVLSRYPIVSHHSVMINRPQADRGFDDQYRAYLEVVLSLGSTKTTVATTHMSFTDRFEITARKRVETDRLVKLVRSTARSNYVLAGDFNAEPQSYTIESLKSCVVHIGPDHDKPTWTTKPFSHNGFEAHQLRWRLDYVFASPDVECVSAEILDTQLSDHKPIMCEVRFQGVDD